MVEYRGPEEYGAKLGLQASLNPSNSTQTSKYYSFLLQYRIGHLSLLGVYDAMKSSNGYNNLYAPDTEYYFSAACLLLFKNL